MRNVIVVVILLAAAAWAGPDTQPNLLDTPGHDGNPEIVVRIYDIRDYLIDTSNYPLDAAGKPPMTRPKNTQTPDFSLNSTGNSSNNPVSQPAQPQPDPSTGRIDDLIQLIEALVAPDTWRDEGGSIGSIRDLDGKLYISQTADAQTQVAKVINAVTANAHRTLSVTATWLLLNDDELTSLRDARDGAASPADAIIRLSDQAMRKANAKPFARCQLLCLDGQTVHTTASSPAGPAAERIMLQIQAMLASSNNEVLMDVLNIVKPADTRSGRGSPATQPSDNAVDQQFHTTARIPLGAEIVIGGITADQGGKDQPKQLYLVMRVDASQ